MFTRWSDFFTQDANRTLSAFHELGRYFERAAHEWERGVNQQPERYEIWNQGQEAQMGLFDRGDHLMLLAMVPGMKEQDLKIQANAEAITLTGERKVTAPEGYAAHRQERTGYRFSRTFTFPCRIDVEKIAATLKDGFLQVKVEKAPEAQPRQIAIKVSDKP